MSARLSITLDTHVTRRILGFRSRLQSNWMLALESRHIISCFLRDETYLKGMKWGGFSKKKYTIFLDYQNLGHNVFPKLFVTYFLFLWRCLTNEHASYTPRITLEREKSPNKKFKKMKKKLTCNFSNFIFYFIDFPKYFISVKY